MTQEFDEAIELIAAQRFLCFFNIFVGGDYIVSRKISEAQAPDIKCIDVLKRNPDLLLEIGYLENHQGDYRLEIERIREQREGPKPGFRMNEDPDQVIDNLGNLLKEKLKQKHEGTNTALIIGRIFAILKCDELIMMKGEELRRMVESVDDNFPAGIWLQCAEQQYVNLLEI